MSIEKKLIPRSAEYVIRERLWPAVERLTEGGSRYRRLQKCFDLLVALDDRDFPVELVDEWRWIWGQFSLAWEELPERMPCVSESFIRQELSMRDAIPLMKSKTVIAVSKRIVALLRKYEAFLTCQK